MGTPRQDGTATWTGPSSSLQGMLAQGRAGLDSSCPLPPASLWAPTGARHRLPLARQWAGGQWAGGHPAERQESCGRILARFSPSRSAWHTLGQERATQAWQCGCAGLCLPGEPWHGGMPGAAAGSAVRRGWSGALPADPLRALPAGLGRAREMKSAAQGPLPPPCLCPWHLCPPMPGRLPGRCQPTHSPGACCWSGVLPGSCCYPCHGHPQRPG